MSDFQNIDKYREARGLRPLSNEELMKLASQSVNETERWQSNLDKELHNKKQNHFDRFGNYHIYD